MTGRGRSNYSHDWDPMRDDYNNSMYDAQYPDDDAGTGVQLDHTRLYITNIPHGLSDDGLRTAFSKFGELREAFVSRDANKRYALVKYDTSSEAKLAMMKMNKTEPLKLHISIAHKTRPKNSEKYDSRDRYSRDQHGVNGSTREDTASLGSREKNSRRQDHPVNGGSDMMDDLQIDDDLGLVDAVESSLTFELERLKLEQLKLQEQQLACKHRMLLLRQTDKKQIHGVSGANRRILPDGRIEVRNMHERSMESRDGDVSFGAGAGDSLNVPALQPRGSRQCVRCGRAADAYCSGCGVTPYCNVDCQRRDWRERHKDVCHNLARLSPGVAANDAIDGQPAVPPVAPLRRPPAYRDNSRRDEDVNAIEKSKFLPPDHKPQSQTKQRNFRPKTGYANNLRRPHVDSPRSRNGEDQEEEWETNKGDVKQDSPCQPSPVHKPRLPSQAAKESPKRQHPNHTKNGRQENVDQPAQKAPEPVTKKTEPVKQSEVEAKTPISIADVTPTTKKRSTALVPTRYLIETLSVGDTVLLSVELPTSQCRTSKPGYVCLSINEKYESDYQKLCEEYVVDCEADSAEYSVTPGETFSYFNQEDGGWYRARCLTPGQAALLDGSKLVALMPNDKCKKLADGYQATPEFCCVLDAKNIEAGQNLKCVIVSKTADGCTLSLEDVDSGAPLGTGEVSRWLPEVEHPQLKTNTAQAPVIPEVPRPPVRNSATVLLVEATTADRVLVRPADADSQRRFDSVVQDVAVYGSTATPLKEPPVKGSTVIAKYIDDNHYRAIVRRTNVAQNKYLLEYIEFGNSEIVPLENLYPCPQEMTITTLPTEVSVVQVPLKHALTAKAQAYLEGMKDQELIVTLPNGVATAPSGSEATLTLVKTKECVNTKLQNMCKPEWKKIEETGGDVIETKQLMYSDLQHLELPAEGCVVEVLDYSMLAAGVGEVAGCQKGLAHKEYVYKTLRQQMTEYCNSDVGREPYLPKAEELCIAKDSTSGIWHRAVLMEQESGAGGSMAQVYYIDRGNTELLPVTSLRKILPEFVDGLPAVALELEITGFPSKPTAAMVTKALCFINSSKGELRVADCVRREEGMYTVSAQELLAAVAND